MWSLVPDTTAVLEAVRARPDTERVGLLGISLGSVLALGTASKSPGTVEAVVAEGVFSPSVKLEEMVGSFAAAVVGWAVIPANWNVMEVAGTLDVPVLFIHGTEDGITKIGPAAEIFVSATASPAPRPFWITEAGHAPGIAGLYGEEYTAQVAAFLSGQPAARRLTARRHGLTVELETSGERRPAEVAVIYPEADPEIRRVWAPGTIELTSEPGFVSASVPAARVVEDGDGWRRDDAFVTGRAEWEHVETDLYERLGYGVLMRIAGARFFFNMGEPPDEEELGRACTDALGELARILDGEVHPLVRPYYFDILFALGARCQRLGRPDDARTAYERAVSLLPERPFAQFQYGDAAWDMGTRLEKYAQAVDRLADLAENSREWLELKSRARRLMERAIERSRHMKAWADRQRIARET